MEAINSMFDSIKDRDNFIASLQALSCRETTQLAYHYEDLGRMDDLSQISKAGMQRNMLLVTDGSEAVEKSLMDICKDENIYYKNYCVMFELDATDHYGLISDGLRYDVQNYEAVAVGSEIDKKLAEMQIRHKMIPYPVNPTEDEIKLIKKVLSQ